MTPPFDLRLYRQLLDAYRRCIRNKPRVKTSRFHLHHESNLHALTKSLLNRSYKPWKSNIFIVTNPKPREVIAAHMRDRVVHHLLYQYMSPYWERRFSKNSYACRQGKGPLLAVRHLEDFVRGHRRQQEPALYYLKVDIQSFFASIDLNVLQQLVRAKLSNEFYTWLFEVILWHRATEPGNYQLKSPPSMWQLLPDYKSLFHAPPGRGLPIGNLTSQFFANVYLNELDQFITHRLQKQGLVFWQRYVDDILLISSDRDMLRGCVGQIQEYLTTRLHISLNYRKTILQPVSNGIDYLGYFVKPTHTLVRRRVVGNYRRKMARLCASTTPDVQQVVASANSYFGYFAKADSHNLRRGAARDLLTRGRGLASQMTPGADFTKLTLVEDAEQAASEVLATRERRGRFAAAMAGLVREPRQLQRYLARWRDIESAIKSVGHP